MFRKIAGVLVGIAPMATSAFAADTPFAITAPTFDWSVLGTVAASMMALGVGIVGYRKVKSMMNRG